MERIRHYFTYSLTQWLFIILYTGSVTLWLWVSDRAILPFLLLLFSLLLLRFLTSIPLKLRLLIGALILVLIIPMVAGENRYYMEVATQVGIYVAMALGLNIVVGFAGLLDLGYVAFFAVGAYSYAIFASPQAGQFISAAIAEFPLSGVWFWPFLVIGLLIAALFGILLGLPVLKVRGDYLAIVTLGFGEIIRIVFNNLDKPVNITNGPQGLTPIQPPVLFGLPLNTPFHFYFIVLFMIGVVLLVNKRLEHSRLGRAWIAIREDELAARAMGIPLIKTKLLAFATGASFAGIAGVIFAAKQSFVDPSSFTLMESIGILVMVMLGGSGSISGVILGATLVTLLQVQVLKEFSNWLNSLRMAGIIDLPNQLDPSKFQRFVFGILLIVFALYRPKGLIPARRKKIDIDSLQQSQLEEVKRRDRKEEVSG
ncbi:MAG TPA: branched-chain amino acid ABC transporter permease [Paenibacillaceae bacterium]|nr:branched-chain amino acid ABC transporter permease [Paenibacillaceae bacterium]